MAKALALSAARFPSTGGIELARTAIVISCALAAIFAGPVLPL